MEWKPTSEADLLDMINQAWDRMLGPERHFWEMIRIEQQKWQCPPWGDLGGGFWVVAIIGGVVVWYNDIEHGFNCSAYTAFGEFSDYWCNQSNLDEVIKVLKGNLDHGYTHIAQFGPPIAGEFKR